MLVFYPERSIYSGFISKIGKDEWRIKQVACFYPEPHPIFALAQI